MLKNTVIVYEKSTQNFDNTVFFFDPEWVVAVVSFNHIKKDSVQIFFNNNAIIDSSLEAYNSNKYSFIIRQTTLKSFVNETSSFFFIWQSLILNKKYLSKIYYKNHNLVYDNQITFNLPKCKTKKSILTLIKSNFT